MTRLQVKQGRLEITQIVYHEK